MEYSFGTLDNTIWQGCTGGCIVMVFGPIRTGQGKQRIYHYKEDTLLLIFKQDLHRWHCFAMGSGTYEQWNKIGSGVLGVPPSHLGINDASLSSSHALTLLLNNLTYACHVA